MADYTFDSELVADPFSFQRAANSAITIYDVADENNTAPLALKDLNGFPLPNPLASNADAFVPAFVAPSAQVKMVGGGLQVVKSSFKGMRDEALAAKSSAAISELSAVQAAETAAATVTEALAGAVSDAQNAAQAAVDAAALVGAPADNAVAAILGNPSSQTSTALAGTIRNNNFAMVGDVNDTERLKSKISGYGTKSFVRRLASTYEFGYQMDDKRYMTHTLGTLPTAPGGYTNLLQLQDAYVRHPLQGHQETEMTLTGSWVASTSGTVYGGSAQRSNTAGNTAVFTVPSGSDDIGLIASSLANAGAAKVTIVDSTGAAVDAAMLPTAQQQVDGSLLPSTVLVANGGTLNPTDRVLNLYSTAGIYADSTWMLAQGLNQSRTHTVTVTVTGYKHASATDSRVYVSGFCHSGPGASFVPEKAWSWVNVQKISPNAASAWEYAVAMNLGGVDITMGNVHGYDNQTSFTITVDGVVQTLAVGDTAVGRTLVIDRGSDLFHTSSTPRVASAITRYNVSAPDGMRVQTKLTWEIAGSIRYAMQGMWPYSATFTRATWAGADVDYNVTDANNSEKGHVKLFTFAAWHPTGDYAGFIGINPDGVANWEHSPVSGSYLQDRDTDMKKLYFPWNLAGSGGDPTYVTSAGETWTKEAHYRVARVPGADKVMSRL